MGDAGALVEPRDRGAWIEALHAIINDSGRRAALQAAGKERAAAFTWERTARATFEIYTRAAGVLTA